MMSIPSTPKHAISNPEPTSAAKSATGRALLMMTIAFVLTYFASRALAEGWNASIPLKVSVVLLPAIPLALLLVMFARAVRSMDALHVRVHLEALAIAFPVTLLLLPLNRDDWSYRHVWAIGSIVYFSALALAWRRYK